MSCDNTDLNPQQNEIINRLKGAVLVLAPVGTGKTRVLAERVIAAVKSGIAPDRILCLTFTNRAAQEMRQRLTQYNAGVARAATLKTFHALCAQLLRSEARAIGLPTDFVIYDDRDCKDLINEIFEIDRKYAKENERNNALNDLFSKITDAKTVADDAALSIRFPERQVFASFGTSEYIGKACQYQRALRERHALDFSDLIYYARAALRDLPDVRERWETRFDFVQVDEMQDTNLPEYDIVRAFARRHGNIAMIGDIDQTLYGWRGSEPDKVVALFKKEFKAVALSLDLNYRSTKILLKAADSVAATFNKRHTAITPAECCDAGEPIRVTHAADPEAEARWIGRQMRTLTGGQLDYPYKRIAVLTRTNLRASTLYNVLEREFRELPCITVEQYEFFQRQEIKDVLSFLRLLVNPFDNGAMHRIALNYVKGVGAATLTKLMQSGTQCGLKLTDFATPELLAGVDPFYPLLEAWSAGTVVVFDVESTGLDVESATVVEIAAQKLAGGKRVATFHQYIKGQAVGESVAIHGLTDEFLNANGQAARQVLSEFFAFARGALLVGHNVGYDVKMVMAHARRAGIDAPELEWADTYNTATRFVESGNYRLATLAETLHLGSTPTHRADADVETTVRLAEALMPLVAAQSAERAKLMRGINGRHFKLLAQLMMDWRSQMGRLRPAELLARVLDESGVREAYAGDPERKRRANLDRLVSTFSDRDDPALHPETALRAVIEFTALAKNLDQLTMRENKVAIITIHQSKGLEFDTVFLAGACEDEMPTYQSRKDPTKLEEEKRVFYVAMTRAKQRLFISSHAINAKGYAVQPSRFIGAIARDCIRHG